MIIGKVENYLYKYDCRIIIERTIDLFDDLLYKKVNYFIKRPSNIAFL